MVLILAHDRDGRRSDTQSFDLADRDARDRLVARIRRASKATAAHDGNAQSAVREHLVVMRDGLVVDDRAHAFGGLAIGQLPETAE